MCTVNNVPAALFLNAESKGGTVVIELTSLQKDKDKAERLFTKFTHAPVAYLKKDKVGGYTTLIENTSTEDERICNQIVTSPEGKEQYKYETKSTITGTDDDCNSQFKIRFKSKEYSYDSEGSYHHKKSGTKIDGNFSGEMTTVQKIKDKKETTKSSFKGTLVADENGKKIELPEVVEGSVAKVSDREGLSNELYPDLESGAPFDYINVKSPYMQYMTGILTLFSTEED